MSEVKATKDYSLFGAIEGNREVNSAHVKRLMRAIKDNDLTAKFPIVVNKNMEVVDGQHRLVALQKLDLPVHYRVEDNVPIEDIRIINQVVNRWTWLDLAKSYVEMGNEAYKVFIDLYTERPSLFNVETLCSLANINFSRGNTRPLSNYFFGGGLTMSEEQRGDLVTKAYQLADFADTQPHFKQLPGKGRDVPRPYVTAMTRIMRGENYDHRTFIQRLMASNTVLPQVVDVNEALRELEKAYNKNLGEDKRVRLF